MVCIKDTDFIGKGLNRSCYRHPDFKDKCIKIFHENSNTKSLQREIRETKRLLLRDHGSLVIPQYFGEVETDRGPGFVFELIQGKEGAAPTLKEYLLSHSEEVERIKGELYSALYQSAGVFSDLSVGNILIKEEPDGVRFAVIDGLGEGTLIKVCSMIPYFARKKLQRRWRGFARRIDTIVAG